jgi:hypothetical protein
VPVADRLEITEVDLEPEGDARFPEIAAVDREKAARTGRAFERGQARVIRIPLSSAP